MLTQEPVHTKIPTLDGSACFEQSSGLQVLCLEVERQLNRHYKRVLAFFRAAFSDKPEYPLSPEQAVMLFCISNGVCDTVQLCRAVEPVTSQSIIILAGLYAQGHVASDTDKDAGDMPELSRVVLTEKGQCVADGLSELYTYVFMSGAGKSMPDTQRLASMHVSLYRLQSYSAVKGARLYNAQ